MKSYLPSELQVTAPKGSVKVLTGIKKPTNVISGNKSTIGIIKSRTDSRTEVHPVDQGGRGRRYTHSAEGEGKDIGSEGRVDKGQDLYLWGWKGCWNRK